MKRIVVGGLFTVAGTTMIYLCYLIACGNLITEWSFSRYLASVFQTGDIGSQFVLALAVAAVGVVLIVMGLSPKGNN